MASLKVLMQNRPNAVSQPGGDTVVMQQIAAGLRSRGITVDIDLNGQARVEQYDLAHLFNFATPQITEAYARRCVSAGRPFVVTTMYEDLPVFYHQMVVLFQAFQKYLSQGQPQNQWNELIRDVRTCAPSSRWENSWTASHAEALIVTGKEEQRTILRDYPAAKRVETYRLGCEVTPHADGGEAFRRETGLSEFILCVGRLETRKNQLMLLKALEDSDIPLVFATGGFTYQPEYEAACRQFRRAGKTVFLGRLSPELLASAYQAARVHALPSWYELPGIVSLEAARHGTNVVVTDYGTARDYFGNKAFYCEPDDAEGIYNALVAAYFSPKKVGLSEVVETCTWKNAADRILAIYETTVGTQAINPVGAGGTRAQYSQAPYTQEQYVCDSLATVSVKNQQAAASVQMIPSVAMGLGVRKPTQEAQLLCDEGDVLAKQGTYEGALAKYRYALSLSPEFSRAERSCGAIYLAQQNFSAAESSFLRVTRLDVSDAKALTGLASCKIAAHDHKQAFLLLQQALSADPTSLTAIHRFVEVCYNLSRLNELEHALEQYLARDPLNADIRYCLAGCCYKKGDSRKAKTCVDQILQSVPTHSGARELLQMLTETSPNSDKTLSNGIQYSHQDDAIAKLAQMETAKRERRYEAILPLSESVLSNGGTEQKALANVFRGEAFACLGDLQAADRCFQDAENIAIYRSRALAGRGAIHAALQKWQMAEGFFHEALQLHSENDIAIAGQGMCAVQRGDFDQAWGLFKRALAVNPENLRALVGVIQVGYPLNKLKEVEFAIETYLELHPADLSVLYAHAGCCYAQGKVKTAVEQLEKIRIFDPSHQLANELLDRIQTEGPTQQVR